MIRDLEELLPTRFSAAVAVPEPAAPGCLVRIYPAEGLGRLVRLDGGSVLIGRDPAAQLAVEDDSVSRRHAVVEHAGGVDVVRDLESTNGTWVNEQRITQRQLSAGDRLRCGNQIFTYLSASSLEAQYHESVYKIMTTDGLTQACNRRFLMESLDRELARSRRRGLPLSVLMLDLDHFKSINDTFGHLAGDAVLVEFVRRAASILEGGDVLARFGGEEFCIILPDTPLEEAVQIAELIRTRVSAEAFRCDQDQIAVTVSIGVAEYRGACPQDAASFLESADRTLYVAKVSGRNQVRSVGS